MVPLQYSRVRRSTKNLLLSGIEPNRQDCHRFESDLHSHALVYHEVDKWCEERFGKRSAATWDMIGSYNNSTGSTHFILYVVGDAEAFETRMRWG